MVCIQAPPPAPGSKIWQTLFLLPVEYMSKPIYFTAFKALQKKQTQVFTMFLLDQVRTSSKTLVFTPLKKAFFCPVFSTAHLHARWGYINTKIATNCRQNAHFVCRHFCQKVPEQKNWGRLSRPSVNYSVLLAYGAFYLQNQWATPRLSSERHALCTYQCRRT